MLTCHPWCNTFLTHFCVECTSILSCTCTHQQPLPGSFGDMIPFGDPAWYQRFNSPYYQDSHVAFRDYVRNFVETEIVPDLEDWIDEARPPAELMLKLGDAGLLPCMSGPPFPTPYVHTSSVGACCFPTQARACVVCLWRVSIARSMYNACMCGLSLIHI